MSATCGPPFGDEDPTGSIKDPKNGDKFDDSEKIIVKVDASDDNEVASVELFVDGTSSGSKTSEPYKWEIGPLDIGEHELKATITDDKDNTAETDEVTIEVEEASDDTTTTTGDDDDDDDDDDSSDDDDDDDDDDDNNSSDDDDDDDSSDDDDDNDDDSSNHDDDDNDSSDDDDDDDSAGDSDDSEDDSGVKDTADGCTVASNSRPSPMPLAALFGLFGILRSRRRTLR